MEEITKKEWVEMQELLWKYSNWLFKNAYIDSDYYAEEPKAVDEFIKDNFKLLE